MKVRTESRYFLTLLINLCFVMISGKSVKNFNRDQDVTPKVRRKNDTCMSSKSVLLFLVLNVSFFSFSVSTIFSFYVSFLQFSHFLLILALIFFFSFRKFSHLVLTKEFSSYQ